MEVPYWTDWYNILGKTLEYAKNRSHHTVTPVKNL
jgi:hypothetical protein